MASLIATILVLAFLVYMAWPWFWHILTTLALVLLVYLAWPWFLQKPWEDLMSWVHVPQQKALGMSSLIAPILVLAFLVYMAWPWFWHIVTTLALVLLVYLAWPWFLQKPWEDLMSWLQQIHVPQQIASATNTPSGRLYVSPQRTDESRIHFEELGQEEYPRPYPRPVLVDRWRGHDVFWWKGECWFLRHNEEPYRFLCVVQGRLQWCRQARPNACAVPCKSPDTGKDGWCWREVSYRNDS